MDPYNSHSPRSNHPYFWNFCNLYLELTTIFNLSKKPTKQTSKIYNKRKPTKTLLYLKNYHAKGCHIHLHILNINNNTLELILKCFVQDISKARGKKNKKKIHLKKNMKLLQVQWCLRTYKTLEWKSHGSKIPNRAKSIETLYEKKNKHVINRIKFK